MEIGSKPIPFVHEVIMPPRFRVRIFSGAAAPQGGLVGGGNQVFFDTKVDPSWKVNP